MQEVQQQQTLDGMTPNYYSDEYAEDVMRDMPSRLQCVEDDLDESIEERQAAAVATPLLVKPVPVTVKALVRPVAVKVMRPIPRRVTQQFYNEAYEEGLTLDETRTAALVAQEWHRKWTQQDEEGHTSPNEDFYQKSFEHTRLDSELDRHGAKNPSLGDSDSVSQEEDNDIRVLPLAMQVESPEVGVRETLFCPDDRLSGTSWSSQSSSLSSHMAPQVRRHYVGVVIEDDMEDDFPQPDPQLMVRPVALRVSRPSLPPAPHDIPHGDVPHDITAETERDCFSPVSFAESSIASDSFMITLANQQHEERNALTRFQSLEEYDDDDDSETDGFPQPARALSRGIIMSRDGVLHALAITHGDVDSEKFKLSLEPLKKYFSELDVDTRLNPAASGSECMVEGMWLTLSKPTYFSNLGENDSGDPMYTLGRMAFDMFSPTNLVCSLQGNFNPVEIVDEQRRKEMLHKVPKSLRAEVESGETVLRTYHVVAAFTIEPNVAGYPTAPNKDVHRPVRGIMTTYGYSLPDPKTPNRHSVWFTGGRIEPNNNPADIMAWKRLFTKHPPKHSFGEKAKLLAVKMLMGATVPERMADDGSMEYTFTRPLGGHGMAYVDIVYLDETLRIVQGHRGTVMVFSRLPQH